MVVEILYELTKGDAILTTGVGQHQMWAAQFYNSNPAPAFDQRGLGAMATAFPPRSAPKSRSRQAGGGCDGDGLLMNVQELATAHIEKIAAKVIILNNQHLGCVQWRQILEGIAAHVPRRPGKSKQIIRITCDGEELNVPCERVITGRTWRRHAADARFNGAVSARRDRALHGDVIPFIPAGATWQTCCGKCVSRTVGLVGFGSWMSLAYQRCAPALPLGLGRPV